MFVKKIMSVRKRIIPLLAGACERSEFVIPFAFALSCLFLCFFLVCQNIMLGGRRTLCDRGSVTLFFPENGGPSEIFFPVLGPSEKKCREIWEADGKIRNIELREIMYIRDWRCLVRVENFEKLAKHRDVFRDVPLSLKLSELAKNEFDVCGDDASCVFSALNEWASVVGISVVLLPME